MTAGWQTRPVAEICTMVTDGSHFSPSTTSSGYPYITVRDVKEGQIDFENCAFVSKASFDELRRNGCAPSPGDVLFSKDGTVGKVALVGSSQEFVVLSSLAILRPNASLIDPAYLAYVLMSPVFLETAIGQKTGVAIRRIILKHLKQIPVSYPSLAEQRRIVAILDEAFEGIANAKANAEKNLQNARELFDSKLHVLLGQDVAGWPRKTLREVSIDFGRGKSKHRPRNDPKLYGGAYPFIQTGDVRGAEHLITEYRQTYNEAGLAQSKLWPRGTLCITIAANIAETGVLDFEACFPDSVIGLVVDESETSGKYVEYMLHTVKADLKAKGKGSAQDNINLATFENERFPFPALGVQARIVSLLDDLAHEVQRLEGLYSLKLKALDELKKALLSKAFTGALTNKSLDKELAEVA